MIYYSVRESKSYLLFNWGIQVRLEYWQGKGLDLSQCPDVRFVAPGATNSTTVLVVGFIDLYETRNTSTHTAAESLPVVGVEGSVMNF